MNEELRKDVKLLKAMQNVKYKELAEYLEIKESSFYSWLHEYYDFGYARQQQLKEIISNIRE